MSRVYSLQGRNRDTDVENKRMDTKGGKWWGGGVMNWEIGIDMYTLICIKWIANKNLLIALRTPLLCTVETNTTL